MNNKAFLEKMAEVLETDKDKLSENFELTTDNWDSVVIVETIDAIDEQYGVTVPVEALKSCSTVGDLLNLVNDSLNP